MEIKVNDDNLRLDKYLVEELDLSRSQIQKYIKNGSILINGELTTTKYLVKKDDIISINIVQDVQNIAPEAMDLDIKYEDDSLLIVNKPSGLVVHPAPGHHSNTLVNGLKYYSDQLSSINGEFRPGIVHRIDKDTSGLLIICKNNQIHELISQMLQEKTIVRSYIALVNSVIEEDEGEIIAPIGRDIKDRLKMAVTAKNSKYAETHFKVLKRFKNTTLIECNLKTGRTHQIRVHMNFINHPIVNDPLYGIEKETTDFGQMLHAYKLEFFHPLTNEKITLIAEPPKEFLDKINEEQHV